MSPNALWNDIWDIDIGSSKPSEIASEQASERSKQAQAQLKRIQKDEKQARYDSDSLFLILTRFINDAYYEKMVDSVSTMLSMDIPSRGILSIISLYYPDATYYIGSKLGRDTIINSLIELPKLSEPQEFNEKGNNPQILQWIHEWIQFSTDFLIENEASTLMMKKFLSLLQSDEHTKITQEIVRHIQFFFSSRNIILSEDRATEMARFIQQKYTVALASRLHTSHNELLSISDADLSNNDFFWR